MLCLPPTSSCSRLQYDIACATQAHRSNIPRGARGSVSRGRRTSAFGGRRMRPTEPLRSARLELRRLDGGDAAFVQFLYADARVTRTLLRIQGPISIEEAREFCRTGPGGDCRFGAVLRTGGDPIALGGARRHTESPGIATIGYSVLPAFWGRGFGTELAALLVEFAIDALGALEVRATTLRDNPASARILEKLGFAVLEIDAREVDSRGAERRVTRWVLHGRSRLSGGDRPARPT